MVLQGLVHPQAGGPLAQVMALDTITELAVLGLDTEVLDTQVVAVTQKEADVQDLDVDRVYRNEGDVGEAAVGAGLMWRVP